MRTERQKLGIKIGAFVKRLPISDGHYRNLEGGTKPAAIEFFYLIAKELGIPAEQVGILINDPPDEPRVPTKLPDETGTDASRSPAQARGAA